MNVGKIVGLRKQKGIKKKSVRAFARQTFNSLSVLF